MERPDEYESLPGRVSETALDGIVVIDFTQALVGAFATCLLADMGTDV